MSRVCPENLIVEEAESESPEELPQGIITYLRCEGLWRYCILTGENTPNPEDNLESIKFYVYRAKFQSLLCPPDLTLFMKATLL